MSEPGEGPTTSERVVANLLSILLRALVLTVLDNHVDMGFWDYVAGWIVLGWMTSAEMRTSWIWSSVR